MDLKKLFLRADYQEIIRLGLDRKAKLSLEERVYFIASLSFLGHDTDAGLDLKKYERKMNRDQRCIARFFLSVSHARKGDFSTALPLLVKNLKNAKEPNASPRERFYAFQGVGFFRQLQSRYRLSLKWSSRAYEIAYFEDDILGKILSGDLKAHSLEAVGRFGEAISLFSSISGLAREQGNTNFSDSIEVSLLCLHSRLGLLQDQEEALQERLSILKSFNTYSRTEILIELLRLKNLKGKGNDFLPLFHKAIALAEKNGHRRHRVNLLCRKSAFHLLSGQHDAALRSLLAAEESLDRKNDLSLYSEVLGLRLRVLSERDSDRRAEIILQLKKIALRTGGYFQNAHLSRIEGASFPANNLDKTGLVLEQFPASGVDAKSVSSLLQLETWGMLHGKQKGPWTPMMISLDLVPERIFIVHHGQVFLSNRRVPFQIRKLITCLVNEPCRKEDLVNRIWGYDYNPLRHDPMVLTLVQRAREVLGPFRKHLVVDQGIFELKPRFEWLRFEQIKTEKQKSPPPPALASDKSGLSFRQTQILAHFRPQHPIKVGEIMKLFSTSRMTAYRDLEILRKEGLVRRQGNGRGACYFFHSKNGVPGL